MLCYLVARHRNNSEQSKLEKEDWNRRQVLEMDSFFHQQYIFEKEENNYSKLKTKLRYLNQYNK